MRANELYSAGIRLWKEDGPRMGLPELRAALAERPDDPLYNNAVGFACAEVGRLAEAKERLLYAEHLGYRHVQPHQLLAWVLLSLGEDVGAATQAEKALDFPLEASQRAWTLGLLGSARESNNSSDALALYEEALIFDPKCAPAALNAGRLLVSEGRYELATPYLERGLRNSGEEGEAWFALAYAENRNGNPTRALEALREARSRGFDHPVLAQEMASALSENNDHAGALDWSRRLLDLSPDNEVAAWAHAMAASCEYALGHPDRAIEHFRASATTNPNDPSAEFNLGVALGKAGLWAEAARAFERARHLAPEDEAILSAIGWVNENT